ncbi:hypothetical protein V6N13_016125 [Hibiscus sabdariffa]
MVCKAKGKGKKVAKSKGIGKTKPKGKEALKPKGGVSKDGKCFHCSKHGHWKRNCPIYLEDVKKAKAVGASVSGGRVKKLTVSSLISSKCSLDSIHEVTKSRTTRSTKLLDQIVKPRNEHLRFSVPGDNAQGG